MVTNKRKLRIISILMTILMVISFNSQLISVFTAYAESENLTQAEKDAQSDAEDSIILHAGFWSGPKDKDWNCQEMCSHRIPKI